MPHLVAKEVAPAGWQDFQETGESREPTHIELIFNRPGFLPERVGAQNGQSLKQGPVVALTLPLQVLGRHFMTKFRSDM